MNLLEKVIENGLKAEESGSDSCASILGSKDALEAFAAFYTNNDIKVELIFEYLKREILGVEKFENKEQYAQMMRMLGVFPGFLRECAAEVKENIVDSPKKKILDEDISDSV